ncbi:MAG: M1 family metallopeptidase [Thermonemataceae bacterium]
MRKLYWIIGLLVTLNAQAQLENQQNLFDPIFDFRATPYRSASGAPGEFYWQNRADYYIEANLDTEKHQLTADLTLTYTNNSPETLSFIWMQLDQNKFKADSRGTATMSVQGGRHIGNTTTGYTINALKVNGKDNKYLVDDTRLLIYLDDNPVKAKGGKTEVKISYVFDIPEYGADRMGREEFKKGWVYTMAQWYPRMCVYDDIKGWNVEPYLGAGEFYLEYGDLEYKITTDAQQVVVGSGELLNPAEVYTSEQMNRWAQARKSDETVTIIGEKEVGSKQARPDKKSLTWHFKIENARDIAFGASSAFIIDAAKIDLPNGKPCIAVSAYPEESGGKEAWGRSTEYSKASIEHYSEKWYVYPYTVAANIAGIVGGMEYPGVNFCSAEAKGEGLWGVTDHEFGHNWFPMIVGSNERLHPWMDEGFNTFINHYSTIAFNEGEYAGGQFSISLLRSKTILGYVFLNPNRESIATYPDVVQSNNLGVTAYFKPAIALGILREYVLGTERFDYAFSTYIERWAFKHPTPIDFFNTMENVAGEELDWFWKQWIYGTGTLDQAVEKVAYKENDPAKGAIITISNKKELILPATVEITEEGGNKIKVKLPVEIWQKGDDKAFEVNTTKKLTQVEIDPNKMLPDVNAANNIWKATD